MQEMPYRSHILSKVTYSQDYNLRMLGMSGDALNQAASSTAQPARREILAIRFLRIIPRYARGQRSRARLLPDTPMIKLELRRSADIVLNWVFFRSDLRQLKYERCDKRMGKGYPLTEQYPSGLQHVSD